MDGRVFPGGDMEGCGFPKKNTTLENWKMDTQRSSFWLKGISPFKYWRSFSYHVWKFHLDFLFTPRNQTQTNSHCLLRSESRCQKSMSQFGLSPFLVVVANEGLVRDPHTKNVKILVVTIATWEFSDQPNSQSHQPIENGSFRSKQFI